ncbi:MAG TPA: amidase [Candidatus Acidoferrales bacterium]|nr:amidase [Candidatus Acidoferrales bacterium]
MKTKHAKQVNSSAPSERDLPFASIAQVGALFRRRKLSPRELTELMLERIERLNPKLNAFLTVSADETRVQAKRAEAELFGGRGKKRDRGPLHGIPISLKDNVYTKGVRTTGGSAILRDFVPSHDATVVRQLREAGAILIGKTNLHEFAYGVTTNNPHFGPTRNPWDLERIPGGSSGGSAAAVAAGLCYGSIGTDTGGSIRIPAALCGVVGLKPTLGRASVDGVIPLSPKLDCVGPLARSASDAALLADAIFVRRRGELSMEATAKKRAKKNLRLGIPREFFYELLSLDVKSAVDEALRLLRKTAVHLLEVSLPSLAETEDAGNQIAWPEATHFHQQAGWFPAKAEQYSEDVRKRLEAGTKVLATTYLQALEARERFIQQFHLTLADAKIDALVVPTTPITAPLIGEESTEIGSVSYPTRALLLRLNRPANLAGVPAISVPCGLTDDGLPVGLQFIGAVGDEPLLLQLAARFEHERPLLPAPPVNG